MMISESKKSFFVNAFCDEDLSFSEVKRRLSTAGFEAVRIQNASSLSDVWKMKKGVHKTNQFPAAFKVDLTKRTVFIEANCGLGISIEDLKRSLEMLGLTATNVEESSLRSNVWTSDNPPPKSDQISADNNQIDVMLDPPDELGW